MVRLDQSWSAPVVEWRLGLSESAQHERLGRDGELLARWPPAPFETEPTECFRLGDAYWIWQRGVGGIEFYSDRAAFRAYPSPGTDRSGFEHLVTRSWLPAIYQLWGRQVLHASGAVWAELDRVLALAGPSGAGKSTLAFGLARRSGWAQVSDDTLAFSCSTAGVTLHPLVNDARLRPATAAHYGHSGARTERLDWPERPLRLAAVYFIRGDEDLAVPVEISRLAPAQSYPRLLEQAHAFTLQIPSHNQRLMRDYLALTAAVPVFALTYRRSFDSLDTTLAALERHWLDEVVARPA